MQNSILVIVPTTQDSDIAFNKTLEVVKNYLGTRLVEDPTSDAPIIPLKEKIIQSDKDMLQQLVGKSICIVFIESETDRFIPQTINLDKLNVVQD